MRQKLDVLVVEDSEEDAELILRELKKGGYQVHHRRVCTRDMMAEAIDKKSWDIVLADHNMPGFNSVDALALLKENKLDTPFIIVSGTIGEETAVAAMKAGANDYVMKGNLGRLVPAIDRELRDHGHRLRAMEAEESLRRSEKKYRELVNNLTEVVVEIDVGGKISYISPQAENIYGFRPDELVGRNLFDFVHPDFLKDMLDALSKVSMGAHGFDFEFRWRHKDGHWIYSSVSGRVVVEDGKTMVVGMLQDITGRKQAEEALGRSEQLFRLLAENAKDMIYRIRMGQPPAVEYISPSALAMTGYCPEEFRADAALASALLTPHVRDEPRGAPRMKGNLGGPAMMKWRRKDGVSVWLELVNHPVLNAAGNLVAIEGAARDVTERKQIEDALLESEEKFRNLAEQSPNMIFITMKGRMVYANRRCEELLGYSREQLSAPDFNFFTLVAPEYRNQVAEKYWAHLSGSDFSLYEYAVVSSDGKRIDAILSTRRISFGGEMAMLGTITDITERRRAEEALRRSEEKYRELVENMNDVIFSTDKDGVVTYISPVIGRMLGLAASEVEGKHFSSFVAGEDIDRVAADFGTIITGELRPSEFRMKTKSGEVRWVRTSSRPLLADGAPAGLSGMLEDITERKEADQKIRASLREKETLLREIHHRVKNNLQIINSLLNMQSRLLMDPEGKAALQESQNRVRTMALIHERMCQSTDLSEVDFKAYIDRLVSELFVSLGVNRDLVQLTLELKEVKLDIESAIPCGFIVNELVTNSLKHAFPDGRPGRLRVGLDSDGEGIVHIWVGDDGVGLPAGFDFRNTRTLGLQLVCTLADQLRGAIELEGGKGTVISLSFNPKKARSS